MAQRSKKIGIGLILALTVAMTNSCAAGCNTAASLLHVAGEDREVFDMATDMIRRQLTQLVRLIDDLLDVSRISRGKLELRKERIELKSVLEQAVEMSRPMTEMAHQQLKTVFPAEAVYLEADPVRLTQVVSNLLNNACKFTDAPGRVTLAGGRKDGAAWLEVSDTGRGLGATELPRIFDKYYQATRAPGSGLGLAMVKAVMGAHGGQIRVTSRPGLGSTFRLPLPLAEPAAG